ncbi:zinc finger protein interacting with ribonucleoprotein K-like isoform X2 [Pleurodeles waltl]|uniref:zinc finger protein interacting with ribonucleoprotein K-like isoform X2 n=1 Tax=Pleurodeles waltl TaxID=8319 RepID=UPI00370976EE
MSWKHPGKFQLPLLALAPPNQHGVLPSRQDSFFNGSPSWAHVYACQLQDCFIDIFTVAITFRDVAAYFTEAEWKRLQENQKEFYKKVMKEIHQTLIFLGYKIANPDTLVRITKGEEPHIWEANESGRRIYNNEPSSFCHRAVGPDIFLRIKEEPLCGAKSSDEELEVSSRPSKANYTSDSSNVQYMIKREEKPSGKGSEAVKSKTDLSKENLFVSTDICSGETEESNPFVVAQPDGKEARHCTSPSSGYEVISFPIKEEVEDYPLNHPFYESRGRITHSAGFGKRKGKAADSIHSHQDTLQEEESEVYNDFESALSDSEILSFQLNTDQQCGLYTCAECDKNFTSKESLMIHLRTHSVDKPYPCAKCDKSFSLKRNLKRHQRTHIEENERRYRCDECEKTFCQKDSLVKHKRTHTGERPYHCTECDKRFSVRVNLITHQRIHSSERPYQCTQCDKSFTQKAHLIGHEAKHTGVRPYQCSKCDKSYSFQGSLIRHQSSHTGNAGSTTAAKEKASKKQQI